MEYRTLPHGGERISVIGMGASVIGERPEQEIIDTVRAAYALGVNYFDLAAGHAAVFGAYGKAFEGIRDKVYLQIHFGADYTIGEYGWTTKLDEIRRSVAWQLEQLRTDYIDFGFIHCIDEENDLRAYEENGVLDYVKSLKEQGVIRHLGLSSHTPALVNRVLDMGIVDVVMFSINPIYDYGKGDFGIGENAERYALYGRCQRDGVGITVMKPFCGGQLLDAAQSPFGVALNRYQCIQLRSISRACSRCCPVTAASGRCARCWVTSMRARKSAITPASAALRPPRRWGNAFIASTAIPARRGWISASSTSITTCPVWETYWRRSTI